MDLTAQAQALRADIERRRGQALTVLGDHQQALDNLQAASDQFDQVRAPYMVNNIRDLQALNERRAAEGQPPVPVPSEWQRLAALVTPPQAAPSPQSAPSPNPPPLTIPGLFPLASTPDIPPDAATATSLPIAQTPDSSYP